MSNIGYFSLVSLPVEVLSASGQVLSRASGYFHSKDEKWVQFVTNWHVVTGRRPSSPRYSASGAIPAALRLTGHKFVGDGRISRSQKVQITAPINDEFGGAPVWREHPSHAFKVDVVAIPIAFDDKFKQGVFFKCLADYQEFEPEFSPSVMDNVFVVGYPWGLTGGDRALPLYKRGSVASEPLLGFQDLPRFLIDCRTAEGMSGSPVICSHSGYWCPPGRDKSQATLGTVECFAGVYSGRLYVDELVENANVDCEKISEIGIVWSRKAVEEVVNSGKAGTKLSEL